VVAVWEAGHGWLVTCHIERLKNAQAEELLKHMLVFQAEFAKGGHDE
jgi:hypothetical protein